MYIKITNGSPDQFPYSVGQLRRDHKNVSFPKKVSELNMSDFGMHPVIVLDQPTFVTRTQVISQNNTPILHGGVWTLDYTVSDKSASEVVEYDTRIAANVRAERDALIAKTDWVVTRAKELGQDVPLAIYNYRGDLRQIPDQAGFPHTIIWPTEV